MPDLIDRQRQLSELRQLARKHGPRLALLTGRRRVGKTFLLDHAFAPFRTFYFLCGDTTADRNLTDLLRELSAFAATDMVAADYPTWRSVFRLVASLAERPLVVVLDEFQYLMGAEEGIPSQIVAVWDREVKDLPLTLVLCGSRVSMVERLGAGDSPFYGRISWSERLEPFDYRNTAEMVPWFARREQLAVFGVFGGTPRYLAALEPGEPLDRAVVRTILSTRGEVHLQLSTVVEQEKGIRSPSEVRAVLGAIASGRTRLAEIIDVAGVGDRRHVALHAIETLEDLGLVRRERNFGAGRTAPWRFLISDPAIRFWHRFVEPNRSQLERGRERRVFEQKVAPELDTYLGHTFERVVEQAFLRHHTAWGLPGADHWARWEGQDRNRQSIEVDLVVRTDDGRILIGEVKWSSRPVTQAIHHRLVNHVENLAASGQTWAREAMSPRTSAGRLYVSAAGFDDAFRALSREDESIHLVTLEDLYA